MEEEVVMKFEVVEVESACLSASVGPLKPEVSDIDITKKYRGFTKLPLKKKLQIKEEGRPLPNLVIKQQATCKGRQYMRRFNPEIYLRNKWICGCKVKNGFFCFPCILFSNREGDTKWTVSGVSDLVHLSERIKSHENSKKHIINEMRLALLGTTNIQDQLNNAYWLNIQEHNNEVIKNRYIISKIIDCIKFCGAFELALQGDDKTADSKNPGVFLGLINFTSEIDRSLQEHLQSVTVINGTSKDIQNDLLESMLDVYYQEIKEEISSAPFLAVMADDTTNMSSQFQLSLILRYVKNGNPIEHFWGFLSPSNDDAQTLTNSVMGVLDLLLEENPTKLVAQSYDGGAAVMSGKVQANIKQKYPNAYFVHCYAHELHSIIAQASSQNNNQVRLFFSNIQDIPTFFSNSPKRVALLNEIVERKHLNSAPGQWNFNNQTVNIVYKYREELIDCMEAIGNAKLGSNIILINQAMAIKRMLEDKKFIFWLTFFHSVMPHVDTLSNQLQKRIMDAVEIKNTIDNFEININEIRKNTIVKFEYTSEDEYEESLENTFLKRRKIMKNDYLNYQAAALEVCDVIVNVVKERYAFSTHLLAATLFFPESFASYANEFPLDVLNTIVAAYSMLDLQRLKTELSIIYNSKEYTYFTGVAVLLHFLVSNNLQDVFKQISKLLEIIVTTPMTTTEVERSFSTLKRIKSFLRHSATQDRLTALAVLSIESDFIKAIPNFNDKVIDNFANKKNLGINLLCK